MYSGTPLRMDHFPQKMKIAMVTPIFKAGKKELVINYRPISVLTSLSKVLERIVYNRLYSHQSILTKVNILWKTVWI